MSLQEGGGRNSSPNLVGEAVRGAVVVGAADGVPVRAGLVTDTAGVVMTGVNVTVANEIVDVARDSDTRE